MVDGSKRKTLISLGKLTVGGLVVPAVPTLAAHSGTLNYTAAEPSRVPISGNAVGFSSDEFDSIVGGETLRIVLHTASSPHFTGPYIRVTNLTGKVTILSYIQSGIVHVDNVAYDLNSSLHSSAYAIGAGKSRNIAVSVADFSQTNKLHQRDFRHRNRHIAAVMVGDKPGLQNTSARAFFA